MRIPYDNGHIQKVFHPYEFVCVIVNSSYPQIEHHIYHTQMAFPQYECVHVVSSAPSVENWMFQVKYDDQKIDILPFRAETTLIGHFSRVDSFVRF